MKFMCILKALFYFEMRPIASLVATKLIELDEKILLDGFRDLTPNELEHFCTDSIGSHFIEECINFFEKTKKSNIFNEILDKLKGRFMIIACNKSGSFVIENIWKSASLRQRIDICEELKLNENQLRNDRFARFFYNKIGLSFYKRKPEEWKKIQSQEIKKRNLFSDILDDDKVESNGKRKPQDDCDEDGKFKKKKKWFHNSNKS
jgi:nucleolar protein 9